MSTKSHTLFLFSLPITSCLSQAALVFSETFGDLANEVSVTTDNTDFTYVRTSTGAGAEDPSVINPSNLSSGASGFLQAPSGSLTGVGVGNTLPSSDIYTFGIDFRFTDVNAGDVVFGVGAGTTFTGNSTFTTAQGLFWLQSNNGTFERRTSGWNTVAATTFANDTNYSLLVVANGSASPASYHSSSVAAGTMDIYLNGVLLENDAPVTNSLSANGFRIYSVSNTGVEIDNIKLWNEAIPEPSSTLLAGLSLLALLRRRR